MRLGGKEEGVGMSKGRQGKGVDREEVQREKQKARWEKLINAAAVSWCSPPCRARRTDPLPPIYLSVGNSYYSCCLAVCGYGLDTADPREVIGCTLLQ